MTKDEQVQFIRDNYINMTDAEIGQELGMTSERVRNIRRKHNLMKGSGRQARPTKKSKLTRLEELLEKSGIDIEEIGSLKQVKLNEWQGMYKDDEGEAHVIDMEGMSVVLTPSWADGPEWPVIQQASPVNITPVKVVKPKRKHKIAIVLPDPQIGFRRDLETKELDPFHDERALDIALQITQVLNPDLIVNLGDLLDFPNFSRFEQEPVFQMTTQATIDRAYQFLAEQQANAPYAKIVLVEGNHDRRLQKAIVTNAANAFGLKRAQAPEKWPVLSVPHLLRLDELGVHYEAGYPAASYWINDRLKCIHGRIVRSGGSTAKAVSDNERVSTIFGHVHRIEMHFKTVNVREGGRTNLAFTPGCLCRIDGAVPSTKGSTDPMGRPIVSYENWQQGLGVVTYAEGDGEFDIEPVYIHDGTAIFRGQTYTAKQG